MKKVDLSKLKTAIAAGENHLKIFKVKTKKDKRHQKGVDSALEKAYAILNSKKHTQKEVNKATFRIWYKILNKKPILMYISYILIILLACTLVFTSYETYTFIKTYWDKITDIRVNPGDSTESGSSSESKKESDSSNESKEESNSSNKDSKENSSRNSSSGSNLKDKESSKSSTESKSNDESKTSESEKEDDVDKIIYVNYNESKIVNLEKLSPVTDEVGLKNTAQEIDIYNDGGQMPNIDYTVNYNINIVPLNDGKTNIIDSRYIKYKYYKTDKSGTKLESQIGRLSDLEINPNGSYKFITSSQKASGHDYYKIIFWISSEAGNDQQNKSYTLSFQAVAGVSVD